MLFLFSGLVIGGIPALIREADKYGFKKGEIYDAIEAREPFFGVEMLCITDSSGEEYAYPASWFERIDS